MRFLLTVCACVVGGFCAFADASISGVVYNKATSQPMDYATVQLVNPESGLPSQYGALTDAKGFFTLSEVPTGDYLVRVSMIGSVPREYEVSVGDVDIELGVIELAEDMKMLEEVVVTGQKGQVSISGERRVFNVSSNIASTGASADELLASVPSVDVSSDGEISLRGNNDVLVWINGKQMGMTTDNRAQILKQLPADAVASIEVITNPSSKHSTEGTAGVINILLKEDSRHGYFGNAEVNVDSRGSTTAGFNINYNEGKFESFAGLGLTAKHVPGGVTSRREYDDGHYMNSAGHSKKHESSMFLRLGTNYRPNAANLVYVSAIGTLGHKHGNTWMNHGSDLANQWLSNLTTMHEHGVTRGANILLGYKHTFSAAHYLDMNVSYNIWTETNHNDSHESETWAGGMEESIYRGQQQRVKINNWEAALDYSNAILPWLTFEVGYKGNYNHENSPSSYSQGLTASDKHPLNNLYNRFKYETDITALYVNLSGSRGHWTYSAGLRGELWQIRTRSLGFGQTDGDVAQFKKNDFALFPSASVGWIFPRDNELKLNYSRRIRRPYGPQLNTFENISDPSEVHLGNPLIQPEYSNAVELTYIKNWSGHTLSASGYVRSNTDMISHVSFLAPMVSDPAVNTMYYGHANVGNMLNSGVEIISRNTLFSRLTLTTTVNIYNSHLKAWSTEYPLHDAFFEVYGHKQNRLVWDGRLMASVRLPWDITLQASGRYSSRRVTAQGIVEEDWDVEAGLRKELGAWDFSLVCKDIFDSKKSHDVLYGNGYTQSISKWSGGRTLRLAVTYTFGKSHSHDHHHQHIDTGGYGEEHHH